VQAKINFAIFKKHTNLNPANWFRWLQATHAHTHTHWCNAGWVLTAFTKQTSFKHYTKFC